MNIVFTGHRDRIADPADLAIIAEQFPGANWIHGGAPGFDAQVDQFARIRGIACQVIRPDYKAYYPKRAPLERNLVMIGLADLVVACYDGRTKGGTAQAVRAAGKACKNVRLLDAHPV